jgi:hypothetical protein
MMLVNGGCHMRLALPLSLLFLALATIPAAAQRGGGARGMGGHGMGSPHAGGFAPRPGGVVIHSNGPHNFGQFGNFGINNRFFFNNRFHHHFGRNFGIWPWWGWGWGGWGWGWAGWNSSSYDSQQRQQATSNQQLALQGQVQYLQQQIAEMRHDQEVQRDYAATQAAPAHPPAPAPAASKPQGQGPPTTLVFRDGKRMETQNYAIVDNTLWLMANGHITKYPLSELDREATLKSNEDRGVDFRVQKR